MAKRIRYYYDEESCTFQEEKASAQSIFKKTLVILAGCGILAYSIFFDDPKTIYLKNQNEKLKTKVGWTPFDGKKVAGYVQRVVLRGTEVFKDGEILVSGGFGKIITAPTPN